MALRCGFADLGFARLDTDRQKRRGYSEAVYCPGKAPLHLKHIVGGLCAHKQDILLTKLDRETFEWLKQYFPALCYNELARLGYCVLKAKKVSKGFVLVITAGTADIPIAEEAAVTLEVMGNRVKKLYDVGVAGVHRLMQDISLIKKARCIIVVAGMEGALASLVSGLSKCPVVAVPTSVGYGASFAGLSALLTMLNSCSAGVGTVNIDNGFGAGYLASLMNR
ncbi:MAG TPA: nickel pincer cofactor biosynthesis protein LarB [Candidatus Omnitrophota bacterium]|nr:nickel pincer cofactor biosynthesis protein LarB [Candidatus Omnitrophota bacterium]HNX81978.1 nickel pincer cofactor biosynthesis protein LarB [Candidatus Omnitrophota bacterium]